MMNYSRHSIQPSVYQRLATNKASLLFKEAVSLANEQKKTDKKSIIDRIKTFSCAKYGFTVEEVFDARTLRLKASHRECRFIAIYLLKNIVGMGWSEMGRLFSKHHTTILYNYNVILDEREVDDNLKSRTDRIIRDFII